MRKIKIDILVHPYYSDCVPVGHLLNVSPHPSSSEEKTRIWHQAIAELNQGDYLIFIPLEGDNNRTHGHASLTKTLLDYARRRLGNHVIFSERPDTNNGLSLPFSGIERVRSYGELYRCCVDYWTHKIAEQLGITDTLDTYRRVSLPKELSVSLM